MWLVHMTLTGVAEAFRGSAGRAGCPGRLCNGVPCLYGNCTSKLQEDGRLEKVGKLQAACVVGEGRGKGGGVGRRRGCGQKGGREGKIYRAGKAPPQGVCLTDSGTHLDLSLLSCTAAADESPTPRLS